MIDLITNNTLSDELASDCTCNAECIVMSILVALLQCTGIVANAVVILRVATDGSLRTPTYVGIAGLAVADMLSMVSTLLLSLNLSLRTIVCTLWKVEAFHKMSLYFSFPFMHICYFAAASHVMLLAFIRYCLLVHPVRSGPWLRVKRVVILSGVIWGVAICIETCFYVPIQTLKLHVDTIQIFALVAAVLFYFIPMVISITFHFIKYRTIANVLSACDTEGKRRMSAMITAIIIIDFCLPVPLAIIIHVSVLTKTVFSQWIYWGCVFLRLLTNCLNPLVYAYMSPVFRKSVLRWFPSAYSRFRKYEADNERKHSTGQNHIPMQSLIKTHNSKEELRS